MLFEKKIVATIFVIEPGWTNVCDGKTYGSKNVVVV